MKTQKWEELDVRLSDPVLKTLKQLRFFNVTPVQVIKMSHTSLPVKICLRMLNCINMCVYVCVFSITAQHLYRILYYCIVGSMYTVIIER